MARPTRRPQRKPRRARPRTRVLRPRTVVGVSGPKLDAYDKVTGRARYVDDLRVPGMLHGRTVRSTIARGRITKVVLDPAFDWSGVTVADHPDIPAQNLVPLIEHDHPLPPPSHGPPPHTPPL